PHYFPTRRSSDLLLLTPDTLLHLQCTYLTRCLILHLTRIHILSLGNLSYKFNVTDSSLSSDIPIKSLPFTLIINTYLITLTVPSPYAFTSSTSTNSAS